MYDVIIIGSGISGLFTLKHLIEEGITNVLVLDKNPEPFGVWNIENHPSVYENTHTVSSKLYMTISDFPIPKDTPEFPHHSVILDYYKAYAKHFKLYPYVKQNVTVKKIGKEDGKWMLKTTYNTYSCNYVVIATGTVNGCPNIPDDGYYQNFTGLKIHSDQFEKVKDVEGKKILVVGGSDTAVDSAMVLKNKNKVTVSIKNGVWFQNRNAGAYEPADMFYTRCLDYLIKNVIGKGYLDENMDPFQVNNAQFWWGERGSGIDIWKSKCGYLHSYYVKSRDIIEQISKGVITPENKIISIHEKKVTFETGHSDSFDMILFCTGYTPLKCMKYLENTIVETPKYKHIFYPDDPTIMFVGFIRPYLTAIPMLSELQSRWVAKVICKKVTLPNQKDMEQETKQDSIRQQKEFPCAYDRLKTIVDPYDYSNMIADKIGANYSILQLLFSDMSLCYKVLFCSWNHIVYRLNDPDKDKRHIAIESIESIYYEKSSTKTEKTYIRIILVETIKYIVFGIFLLWILYFMFKTVNQKVNLKPYKKIKIMKTPKYTFYRE